MAKIQTRRTISVRGEVYARLKAHCDRRGIPISRLTQQVIEDELARFEREDQEAA